MTSAWSKSKETLSGALFIGPNSQIQRKKVKVVFTVKSIQEQIPRVKTKVNAKAIQFSTMHQH